MRSSETYEQSYAGNNSTVTAYPITFQFGDAEDLEVMVTTSAGVQSVLAPSAYTVTRDSVTELGSFVTASAIPIASTVKIYRNNQLLQEHDWVTSDTFPADSHEAAMDRLTEGLQSVRAMADRAFRISPANSELDAAAAVVNSLVGLGSSGQVIFRNPAELLSFLSLTAPLINQPTKTWLDNGERALAVPDFLGQLGTQRNTMATYVSTGLAAGNWVLTTSGGVPDNSVTTVKLVDGILSADAAGRAKMADLYITLAKMNVDFITGMTAKAALDDADYLAGWSAADNAFRKFAGPVVIPVGSVMQTKYGQNTTPSGTFSPTIPADGTIPQITEGTQILSVSITPRFADSDIMLTLHAGQSVCGSNNAVACFAIFRSPVTNAIASVGHVQGVAVQRDALPVSMVTIDQPATTSAVTYTVRAGANTGTLIINQNSFGSTTRTTLVAQEIKV